MNSDQMVSYNNKIAGSLFASAKFLGIVAVCMFYAGHSIISGCLLAVDAVLLIACVVVCIKNMNLANSFSLENSNAHSC